MERLSLQSQRTQKEQQKMKNVQNWNRKKRTTASAAAAVRFVLVTKPEKINNKKSNSSSHCRYFTLQMNSKQLWPQYDSSVIEEIPIGVKPALLENKQGR